MDQTKKKTEYLKKSVNPNCVSNGNDPLRGVLASTILLAIKDYIRAIKREGDTREYFEKRLKYLYEYKDILKKQQDDPEIDDKKALQIIDELRLTNSRIYKLNNQINNLSGTKESLEKFFLGETYESYMDYLDMGDIQGAYVIKRCKELAKMPGNTYLVMLKNLNERMEEAYDIPGGV